MKESRLVLLDRYIMYIFGFGMATLIIGGTVIASWQVNKHDQAHQLKKSALQPSRRPKNPLQSAKQVTLKVPYMHGQNKDTLNFMAALKRKSKKELPHQGFEIEGNYTSNYGALKPCLLRFYCPSSICYMEVEINTKNMLLAYYQKKRLVYPERTFAVISQGYVIEVKKSKIVGIGPETEKELALFDQRTDLSIAYQEIYNNAETTTSQVKEKNKPEN